MDFTRLSDFFGRFSAYSPWEALLELAVIWAVVYAVARFVRGTRAAGALKGLLVVVVLITIISRILGGEGTFQRLAFLYDRFLALIAIGLVVIFQPELRRALVRLGETPFFKGTRTDIAYVVDEIVEACGYLSRSKFGAIIVIERQVGLAGIVEGGTELHAQVSAPLLQTIFFPGSALHDLAVIIKGRQVHAASVQLPLAEPEEMTSPAFGSRHRAAVGLTKECDAIVVVVSEETGLIRIAERGRLSAGMTAVELGPELRGRLERGLSRRRAGGAPAAAEESHPEAIEEAEVVTAATGESEKGG